MFGLLAYPPAKPHEADIPVNIILDLNGYTITHNVLPENQGTDNGHVFKLSKGIGQSSGPTLTIIDGSSDGSGTIMGGKADNGGAFWIGSNSTLNIEGGTIKDCQATNQGGAIYKFMLNPDATKLYIPQGGKDYAIASVGGDGVHTVSTEMPVNFKASENGTYTITVNTDHVEMSYLHLIDNMTGNDVKTQKIEVK